MSFLNTTATLHHVSSLPEKTTRDQALTMLSDRKFVLECGPAIDKWEPTTPSSPPEVPEAYRAQARGPLKTECFTVTDIVHAMPAGLWDTNVVSTYEITNITDGLFVRIKSPMGIVMDTTWEVKDRDGGAGLELVEHIEIRCSRLLIGLVKGECEEGWSKIHAKMIARLKEEIEAKA
ncbi:hypothetical protein B0T14DRAFT_32824 [Immersiella caudata]|uniref:DUF7053 domain-containing protein n=1 Tax=Immersiella caudata TaxID=314043 RepID=A0AA39XFI4_9PEZI|nr:hypothetical protein B0T14DRAFT_32824 [Immersiella caudata]